MYYNKTLAKSNTRRLKPRALIFEGMRKAATYYRLVLQGLVYGEKTTTALAEYIKETEPRKHKAHVRSNLGRRDGVLDRLQSMEFIERNQELKCELTQKGLATALTLLPDLHTAYPFLKVQMEKSGSRNAFKKLRKMFSEEYIQELEAYAFSLAYWESVKHVTNELILRGVDVEGMKNEEFCDLL